MRTQKSVNVWGVAQAFAIVFGVIVVVSAVAVTEVVVLVGDWERRLNSGFYTEAIRSCAESFV